jgi:hypothetical protein
MTILQKCTRQVGIYHVTIWVLSTLLHIFYKEISISNLHNVQTVGPTLFVAAPHSNDVCLFLSDKELLLTVNLDDRSSDDLLRASLPSSPPCFVSGS